MFDVLVMSFFDPATNHRIAAELRSAAGRPAMVYGRSASGTVESRMRRVTRVDPSPETQELVARQLRRCKPAIEDHFGIPLTDCEEPQFLRYVAGDFFVAHQDGNTGLVYNESRFRMVSVVVFLSEPSPEPAPGTYGGGSLVLHGPYPKGDVRHAVQAAPGSLVAFRSETTHEVTPVSHGERYTIVSWYR
jgi:SM-20-related protein